MAPPPSGSLSESDSSQAAITIRRATVKDLQAIVKIWLNAVQVAQGLAPPPLQDVLNMFTNRLESQSNEYGFWVAEVNGAIGGWQGQQPCRPNPIMKWAEVTTYVSREHTGLGIATALLQSATERARSTTLTHLVGFIGRGNAAMTNFLESCGWQKVGVIPRARPNDPEFVYYVYVVPR